MGIMPGKWSSYHCNDTGTEKIIEKIVEVRVGSTPDPKDFKVIKQIIVNGYPIFWVKYPSVKNYEGNKILMYPKFFNTDIIKNKMDPHFFTEGDSPIARFEPTAYGWKLATTLSKNL